MPIDSDWTSKPSYILQMPKTNYFTIMGDGGKMLVKIELATGAIEFGEGFSADAAARESWLVMARAYGLTCRPHLP
jgi:hypothetical protein